MSIYSLATNAAKQVVQQGDINVKMSDKDHFDGLTKYIPTESITLYVAAMSASASLKAWNPKITLEFIYVFFAVLTPILFLVLFMRKFKLEDKPLPKKFLEYPIGDIIASLIAFLVWGLAVPTNPFIPNEIAAAVAGILALLVSTILDIFSAFWKPSK